MILQRHSPFYLTHISAAFFLVLQKMVQCSFWSCTNKYSGNVHVSWVGQISVIVRQTQKIARRVIVGIVSLAETDQPHTQTG
jgi:hypothetical protein